MVQLQDVLIYCTCGAENFYDKDQLKAAGQLTPCWSCRQPLTLPPRIRIAKNVVMLNHNTRLFPHHINPQQMYNFSRPVAEVTRHPHDPKIWGLKNLSGEKWNITVADGPVREVEPGRSVTLAVGTRINFGQTQGEIRL
jgi:hypothetical protein